ncbi:hypothetical protein AVEN_180725-1 [Araneus ventricosus]|uniref:Uncharacterized protein n=1 Tax=Araneus ventricosus TaxID=182803 RepID=A0A4Y2FZP2_ARAVE|nr:hypothetical protein AVEN_180725-1 [Araneus ventricosus]
MPGFNISEKYSMKISRLNENFQESGMLNIVNLHPARDESFHQPAGLLIPVDHECSHINLSTKRNGKRNLLLSLMRKHFSVTLLGGVLPPLVESSLPDDTLRAWQRFRAINRGHRETESSEKNNNKKDSAHQMELDGLHLCFLDEIEGEERVSIATKFLQNINLLSPGILNMLVLKTVENLHKPLLLPL